MTPRRTEGMSPAEWKVMQIVWRLRRGAARDVYLAAGEEHDMAPATTKTLLRRLVDKGHLRTSRVGNCFVYSPTRSKVRALCDAADKLLERAADDGAGRVLAHMLKKSVISKTELDELRAILASHTAEDDPEEAAP